MGPPAVVGPALAVGVAALWLTSSMMRNVKEISFQEFISRHLYRGDVESVRVVNRSRAHVRLVSASPGDPEQVINIPSVDAFEQGMREAQRDIGIRPQEFIPVTYVDEFDVAGELAGWVPTIAIMGALLFFGSRLLARLQGGMGGAGRGGGRDPFSVGKANPTVITKESKVQTTFKDVAGLDEAKVEIMEFVKFLQNPGKFTRIGAKLPKGALLVGPPGTGKTLLARATAGEAGVPFFSLSGSDFIEMFVGVGPSRVRDLFKQARESAPSIVFIDEIDAVARKRGKGGFGGSNDERENTLNQLLVEMDGFTSHEGVVVLAGTNRADILDAAILRPGRFDRQVAVELPDIRGRREIFMVHLKPLRVAATRAEVAQRLASLTPGFSGADIANLCNEAALIAARASKKRVEIVDFEAAADRVIGGLEKKNKVISKEEKRLVAYHEAGHAVTGWFLRHADPMLKVTILPRGNSLGYAQYLPQELNLYRKQAIVDKMTMALGGRAAEQVFFGMVSTGALDDLRRTTQMAYGLVREYGMDERVGNLSFQQEEGQFTKPFSEATAQMIDEEASTLVRDAYARAVALVEEKRGVLEALAERLLKDETINHDVLVEVLGEREFRSETYDQYVRHAGTRDWDTGEAHKADSKKRSPKKRKKRRSGGGPEVAEPALA